MAKHKSKVAVIGATVSASFLHSAVGRQAMVEHLSGYGIQNKHTPWGLVTSMVGKVEDLLNAQSILVLFNLEFLEELLARGVDMKRVTLMADTPIERKVATVVYGVGKVVLAGTHTWGRILGHKKQTELLERLMKMKQAADLTFTNPPYKGGLDLKILLAMWVAGLLGRLVCVHPSTWLVDVKTQLGPKSGNLLFRKFQDAVKDHVTRVELFNGNYVFGIGLFVPCVVTEVDFTTARTGTILVSDVGTDEYREVMGLEDITLHGKDWDPTVKEFMGRVQKFCGKFGSLESNHSTGATSQARHPVQLANIRGNWTAASADRMVKDDFYTIVQKNFSETRGMQSRNPRQLIFGFGSTKEQDNFLGYLQTDFARLCVSLLKTNQDLDQGQLTPVPWLDFTRPWDDDQLFTMLGYPRGHAIREYAKRFLPDYHNIYPYGKTY